MLFQRFHKSFVEAVGLHRSNVDILQHLSSGRKASKRTWSSKNWRLKKLKRSLINESSMTNISKHTQRNSTEDNGNQRISNGLSWCEEIKSNWQPEDSIEDQLGCPFNHPWDEEESFVVRRTMDEEQRSKCFNDIKANKHGNDWDCHSPHKVNIVRSPIVRAFAICNVQLLK